MKRLSAKDDSGVVAVIVAMLSIALFAISAFAVDFGMAYANKRQLSTAADAAALAAARSLGSSNLTCDALVALPPTSAVISSAVSTASNYITSNGPSGTSPLTANDVKITCNKHGSLTATGNPVVTISNTATSNTTFARVAGLNTITVHGLASAEIGPPAAGAGLRPFGVCQTDLNGTPMDGQVIRVYLSKHGTACGSAPGEWEKLDICNSHGNNDFETEVTNGAQCTISVPTTIGPYNGNVNPPQTTQALYSSLGQIVGIPQFTTQSGNGNNTQYAVNAIFVGRLCGYQFGNQSAQSTTAHGCSSGVNAYPGVDYLDIKFSNYIYTGNVGPGCSFNQVGCDTKQQRLVQLTQ